MIEIIFTGTRSIPHFLSRFGGFFFYSLSKFQMAIVHFRAF